MATANIDGLEIAYEILGQGNGRTWTITPGGRFSKDCPGVRELAEALVAGGDRALIWDRPNCGASEVNFEGDNESAMQADTLAGLIKHLDLGPVVVSGGSGGARVSLLTVSRHPEVAEGLAVWWISGGVYGLISLGTHYCGNNIRAAWTEDMAAVAALPEWEEVIERRPANRDKILAQDRKRFISNMERWMLTYCPCGDSTIPGLPDDDAARITVPALVFRSGESDSHHTRETSETLARMLPHASLVEPPWGDKEWNERSAVPGPRGAGLFVGWPALAGPLQAWAKETLGGKG